MADNNTAPYLTDNDTYDGEKIRRGYANTAIPNSAAVTNPVLNLLRSRQTPNVPNFANLYAYGTPSSPNGGPTIAPKANPIPTATRPDIPNFANSYAYGNPQGYQPGPEMTGPPAEFTAQRAGTLTRGALGASARAIKAASDALMEVPKTTYGPMVDFGKGLLGMPEATAQPATSATSATPAAPGSRPLVPPRSSVAPTFPVEPGTTARPYPVATEAPAWTGGGSTATGMRQLPQGISMIRGADGVPIFTNRPEKTQMELGANGGQLLREMPEAFYGPDSPGTVRVGQGATGAQAVGLGMTPEQAGYAARWQQEGGDAGHAAPASGIDPMELARQNASDMLAFGTNDPRSPWGALGRKIDMDYPQMSFGYRGRGGGQGEGPQLRMAYLEQLAKNGLPQAEGELNRDAELQRTNITQAGENTRAGMREKAEDYRSEMTRRAQPVTDAQGNMYQFVNGRYQVLTDEKGQPIKSAVNPGQPKTKDIVDMTQAGIIQPDEARKQLGIKDPNKPSYEEFVKSVKGRGSKMTDEQLKKYYAENYGD